MIYPLPEVAELKRLYEDEKLSLAKIGKRFGATRQAVHSKLRNSDVKMRSNLEPTPIDRNELYRLYVTERLSVEKTAKRLGSTPGIVAYAMKRFGIPRRSRGAYPNGQDPLLNLKVRDTTIVPKSRYSNVYVAVHKHGDRHGLKFSVQKIDNTSYRVTRVA